MHTNKKGNKGEDTERDKWETRWLEEREPKSSDCNPLPLLGHTKECNIMSARIRGG